MASTNAPNILLIHSDQHRYDAVCANGNGAILTPRLDALAAEGATFDHAFSTCPICTPARASLMTGSWATTHRSLCIPTSDFYQPARRELPVLTQLLADAGYYVGMVGKYHGELEGGPTDHGVTDYLSSHGYRAWAEEAGLPPLRRVKGLFGGVRDDRPAEQSPVAWQADRVIEMLDKANVTSDAPWMVRWDPPEPHLPCEPPAEFVARYDGRTIPAWPSFPDPLENKPAPLLRQHTIWGTGGWSWDEWEPFVRLYYAQVTELDHHVGRILDRLDELGARENTLVIYSTDHGDFAGGHGLLDKHFNMYDDVLRVPLILRWPGKVEAGIRPVGFVSQEIDIARTIVESAPGVEPPETFAGQNLVTIAAASALADATHVTTAAGGSPGGGTRPGGSAEGAANPASVLPRPDIFSQYFGTESAMYSSRMLRNDRWKYVWNPLHTDELYDLETDPGEITNLVDEPAHAGQLVRMRERLVEWMDAVGDRLNNKWTQVELLGAPNAWEQSQEGT